MELEKKTFQFPNHLCVESKINNKAIINSLII